MRLKEPGDFGRGPAWHSISGWFRVVTPDRELEVIVLRVDDSVTYEQMCYPAYERLRNKENERLGYS